MCSFKQSHAHNQRFKPYSLTVENMGLGVHPLSTSLKCKRNDLSFNKLIVHTLHINGLCIKIYGLGNLTSSLSLIISRLTEEFCRIYKGRNLEFEGLESIYIFLINICLTAKKLFLKDTTSSSTDNPCTLWIVQANAIFKRNCVHVIESSVLLKEVGN